MRYLLITTSIALLVLLAWPGPALADQIVDAGALNIGTIGEQEFMDGYILIPELPVFWSSDVPWRISVGSMDPDMGLSDDASYSKPLEDLMWKISSEQTWIPLNRDPHEIAWGDETGSGVIYIDVIILLDWLSDAPGEYRTDLVFTITPM